MLWKSITKISLNMTFPSGPNLPDRHPRVKMPMGDEEQKDELQVCC